VVIYIPIFISGYLTHVYSFILLLQCNSVLYFLILSKFCWSLEIQDVPYYNPSVSFSVKLDSNLLVYLSVRVKTSLLHLRFSAFKTRIQMFWPTVPNHLQVLLSHFLPFALIVDGADLSMPPFVQ
jgi:hypothetical protein